MKKKKKREEREAREEDGTQGTERAIVEMCAPIWRFENKGTQRRGGKRNVPKGKGRHYLETNASIYDAAPFSPRAA